VQPFLLPPIISHAFWSRPFLVWTIALPIFQLLKDFYIMKPKATCHITRQASMNAHASVYLNCKQAAFLARNEIFHIKFENTRREAISLNQPLSMSAKMAANGIQTHARTNQRCTIASRSRQSFNAR